MKYLFSISGLRRLDEIVQVGLICAFDFDGTLSPIVTQPDKARLSSSLLRRLTALSAYAPIAILTGRSIADIRSRVEFKPSFLIGNHGLEGVPGWEAQRDTYAYHCESWERSLSDAIARDTSLDPGIWIENKQCTLSVHYRLARDRAKCERQLLRLFEQLSPYPRIVHGKCVFSLLPAEEMHKGSALEQLMAATDAGSVIYVGDDVTDEDVFRLKRKDLLSVRIEREPNSAAEYYLHDRLEMSRLLDEILLRMRRLVTVADPIVQQARHRSNRIT